MKSRYTPLLVAAVLTVSACGPAAVVVSPAPHAHDPICADVILDLPAELAGLKKAPTTAQAARAFVGDGVAIVVQCGLAPPPPNTEHCMTMETGSFSVDWLSLPADDGSWTFITYGRDPAVQITVPPDVSFTDTELAAVSQAVSRIEAVTTCK